MLRSYQITKIENLCWKTWDISQFNQFCQWFRKSMCDSNKMDLGSEPTETKHTMEEAKN